MSNEMKMSDFKIPEGATHFVNETEEYRAHFIRVDRSGSVIAEFVPSVNYIGWDFDIDPYPICSDAIPVSAYLEISRLTEENTKLREALESALEFTEVMHSQDASLTIEDSVKLNKAIKRLLSGRN